MEKKKTSLVNNLVEIAVGELGFDLLLEPPEGGGGLMWVTSVALSVGPELPVRIPTMRPSLARTTSRSL